MVHTTLSTLLVFNSQKSKILFVIFFDELIFFIITARSERDLNLNINIIPLLEFYVIYLNEEINIFVSCI